MAFVEQAEFDRQMRLMLDLVLQKAPANAELTPDTVVFAGGKPPKVSGLTLTSRVEKIMVTWNAVPISDLKRYEIQVAATTDFSSATTRFTRETSWTYDEGDPDTTYYIRVRARNLAEATGEYSGTLNATTGQVTTGHIEPGSITTELLESDAVVNVEYAYTEGQFVATGGLDVCQTVTITTEGDPVYMWWSINAQVGGVNGDAFEITLYRDGNLIMTGQNSVFDMAYNYSAGVFLDEPVAGTYAYTVRVDSAGADDKFGNRALALMEVRGG